MERGEEGEGELVADIYCHSVVKVVVSGLKQVIVKRVVKIEE